MTLEYLITRAEDGSPVQKPFAELSIVETPSHGLSTRIVEDWTKSSHEISELYTPRVLALAYNETLKSIHKLFQKTVKHKWDWKILLETLLKAEFVYASSKAYQLVKPVIPKEKEADQEVIPIAHYNSGYKIMISLPEQGGTVERIQNYGIHEFAHYMHHVDAPEHYTASDATMKEALAILVEEEEGINHSYAVNIPHGRAKELLKKANENKFKEKAFKERWGILTNFQKHEDFEDYLDDKLFIVTSIASDLSKHF